MPPREQVRDRERIDRLQVTGHDERADVEVDGVGVRGAAGKWPKPPSSLRHDSAHFAAFSSACELRAGRRRAGG